MLFGKICKRKKNASYDAKKKVIHKQIFVILDLVNRASCKYHFSYYILDIVVVTLILK